jgi:hypothetical protein
MSEGRIDISVEWIPVIQRMAAQRGLTEDEMVEVILSTFQQENEIPIWMDWDTRNASA